MFRFSLVALTATLLLASCRNDKREALNDGFACSTASVSYNSFIKPVIQNSCLTCHGAAVANSAGRGVNLEGHTAIQAWALNGRLLASISHAPGAPAMPQGGGKLDNCTIAKFASWITAGAPNN